MFYRLNGKAQHYIWGGKTFIPQLLQQQPDGQVYAEWWLGTHPSAASSIEVNGEQQGLDHYIAAHPAVLGEKSQQQFGDRLPYLLKILDVVKPLSIQLHPTKKEAEQGFARENAQGIDLKDPKRSYKDDNHKPEMMIALSDFWLLHGFKTKSAILKTLYARPSLVVLAEKLEQQSLKDFYADVMQSSQTQLAQWLLPIIQHNQVAYHNNELTLDNPDYWLLYALEAMAISVDKLDAGLLSFYLLNIVYLKKGEGIFQDAGIPHAYLRGQNIELMASSDNVIRGGLTPKYVDIPELLKIVDCTEIVPKVIAAASKENGYSTYQTPSRDFALSNINFTADYQCNLKSESAEILLVMQGEITLHNSEQKLTLAQGESAFIEAQTSYILSGEQDGYAIIAKLP
ncbi:mannose-6-phosphate isomerase [Gallibacterium anatis]|uniref:mannose-6-phosphate isomerase, class I n=1 Tax=Gallibacterium anatis TaxID=750 RepID=UPI0005317DBD|nr:mannose-6-phosphate isomerase, class I [Gallibacterium anatis]KGQ43919.1 mannose-6-phosphate isomerase [Gallibacterium anatis]KGQ52429.1 mannose-6-phosphate isomerase [Gallibacterium anatis]KGQ58935.1 mannose-6-phosphate isomerase [Gallibacterium anatis]